MLKPKANKIDHNADHRTEAPAEIAAQPRFKLGDQATAGTIIGAHTMFHLYNRGFYIIVPLIYQQLNLIPVQAGAMDATRWISSGLVSMFTGFFVDMYRNRRGLFLGISIMIVAGGYFMVSLAPSYGLILLGLAIAGIGSGTWHPPSLGILSERYPRRRGFLIALHRSTGSVGDTVGPLLVGLLLVTITWQQILQAGLAPAILMCGVLLLLLWNVGGSRVQTVNFNIKFRNQMTSLRKALRGSGLVTLLVISAMRGMGDRTLFLFMPLYLVPNLKMDTVGVGFHMSLLTVLGIASGPIIGAISDRLGRKPMIIMALLMSSIFPPLMVMSGASIGLTVSIGLFGIFLYSCNSLVQAAATDLAEDMKLEGTFVGMLWGGNALLGAVSPIIAGALAGVFGFQIVFYYAAAIFLTGGLLALRLPLRKARQP